MRNYRKMSDCAFLKLLATVFLYCQGEKALPKKLSLLPFALRCLRQLCATRGFFFFQERKSDKMSIFLLTERGTRVLVVTRNANSAFQTVTTITSTIR